jgi:glycosyltransferase involved in cell wall biosynthesis
MFHTTYPNKVFDYMAAGRPTVLAIGGVIRDVIEQAGGGICVSPGDSQAIADAIRYLRNHSEEARQMGDAARTYVTEHFNRDDHADLLEAALLEVTA